MIASLLTWIIEDEPKAFGAMLLVLLAAVCELGFRLGRWRIASGRSFEDLSNIGSLTAGMAGLLAFTLGLTISIAQGRFEAHRNLVLQEANAISTAWLRAKLASGDEGRAIAGLIEEYAKVRLAFTVAETEAAEPQLLARTSALQAGIWQQTRQLAERDLSPITELLIGGLNAMFEASAAQHFAFDSRLPQDLTLALLAGSLLAIGAMGYQFGLSGTRHLLLTWLLLAMWAGGIVLITDLNRTRSGTIRVDPEPLEWTIQSFATLPAAR